jgi:uncharacterized protein YukE
VKLNVVYDELETVGNNLKVDNEELKEILDNIQGIIDDVPNAWKGIDSEIFVHNATEYIKLEKEKRKKVEVLGELITRISGNYKNKDTEWEDKMKKETNVDGFRGSRS